MILFSRILFLNLRKRDENCDYEVDSVFVCYHWEPVRAGKALQVSIIFNFSVQFSKGGKILEKVEYFLFTFFDYIFDTYANYMHKSIIIICGILP